MATKGQSINMMPHLHGRFFEINQNVITHLDTVSNMRYLRMTSLLGYIYFYIYKAMNMTR